MYGSRESSASVRGCGESSYLSKESKTMISGTSINVETKNVSAELHRMSEEVGDATWRNHTGPCGHAAHQYQSPTPSVLPVATGIWNNLGPVQ